MALRRSPRESAAPKRSRLANQDGFDGIRVAGVGPSLGGRHRFGRGTAPAVIAAHLPVLLKNVAAVAEAYRVPACAHSKCEQQA